MNISEYGTEYVSIFSSYIEAYRSYKISFSFCFYEVTVYLWKCFVFGNIAQEMKFFFKAILRFTKELGNGKYNFLCRKNYRTVIFLMSMKIVSFMAYRYTYTMAKHTKILYQG